MIYLFSSLAILIVTFGMWRGARKAADHAHAESIQAIRHAATAQIAAKSAEGAEVRARRAMVAILTRAQSDVLTPIEVKLICASVVAEMAAKTPSDDHLRPFGASPHTVIPMRDIIPVEPSE